MCRLYVSMFRCFVSNEFPFHLLLPFDFFNHKLIGKWRWSEKMGKSKRKWSEMSENAINCKFNFRFIFFLIWLHLFDGCDCFSLQFQSKPRQSMPVPFICEQFVLNTPFQMKQKSIETQFPLTYEKLQLIERSFQSNIIMFVPFLCLFQMTNMHFNDIQIRFSFWCCFSYTASSNNDWMPNEKFANNIGTLRCILVNICYHGRTILCREVRTGKCTLRLLSVDGVNLHAHAHVVNWNKKKLNRHSYAPQTEKNWKIIKKTPSPLQTKKENEIDNMQSVCNITMIPKNGEIVLPWLLLLTLKKPTAYTQSTVCKRVYAFIRDVCVGLPSIQFSWVQPDKLCECGCLLGCLVHCVNVRTEL